jgi:hypothetical protein
MKKIIILFLLISFCGGTGESFEESTGDEEIQSNDNLSFLLSSVNIYEFGEGPYNLEQCKNIGEKLKANILLTGSYILQTENTSEYIRKSTADNLDTIIMLDELMGNKEILPLSESPDEYSEIANKTYFVKFPEILEYLDFHKNEINKLYVARDMVDNGEIQLDYNFKELSIITQGGDKNIELLIEFKKKPEQIYYFEGISGLELGNGKEPKIKYLLSRYDFIVDTGIGFRGYKLNFQIRSEYFYNNLAYTTILPLKNGEYTEEWYINLLETHLNSLNEFSFFITVFPECKGDLKIKNISNDLSYQYENIDKRLKNFIDLTNYFETVFYPPSFFEYSIKDSLLNY